MAYAHAVLPLQLDEATLTAQREARREARRKAAERQASAEAVLP